MRDVNRIEPLMKRLTELWKTECPDWRFGQLISNLQSFLGDPFYIEDDEMAELIEKFFGKTK